MNRKGLTLVEVMITLMVSGLLLSGVWQLFHTNLRAYRHGLQTVAMTQEARTVVATIIRDIQRAVAAGRVRLRGIDAGIVTAEGQWLEADRLELVAAFYPSLLTRPVVREPAVRRLRYALTARHRDGRLVLQRQVLTGSHETKAHVLPLSERVQGLALRYFDGQTWYAAWQRPELPHALEISLVLRGYRRGAPAHRFVTIVALE